MSRIGKKPIQIPPGATITVDNKHVTVSGKGGILALELHSAVTAQIHEVEGRKEVVVSVADPENEKNKALWGLFRRLIENMFQGVSGGYTRQLEMIGVGYKANVSGEALTLEVGFSHPVKFQLPKGITAKVEKNIITLQGIDKYLIGETAAQIRRIRKPEPYKGKGIRYVGEVVRKKAGKAATKAAA